MENLVNQPWDFLLNAGLDPSAKSDGRITLSGLLKYEFLQEVGQVTQRQQTF